MNNFAFLAVEAVRLETILTGADYVEMNGISLQTDCDVTYEDRCDDGWYAEKSRSAPFPLIFFENEKIYERNHWCIDGPWKTELPAIVEAKVVELRNKVRTKREEEAAEAVAEQASQLKNERLAREQKEIALVNAWADRGKA